MIDTTVLLDGKEVDRMTIGFLPHEGVRIYNRRRGYAGKVVQVDIMLYEDCDEAIIYLVSHWKEYSDGVECDRSI